MKVPNTKSLRSNYSDNKFIKKIISIASSAGRAIVVNAFTLYYGLKNDPMPRKVQFSIIAALAYFIIPTDFIPDFLAGTGLVDDLAALVTTLRVANDHISEESRAKARESTQRLFKALDRADKEVDPKDITL